MTIPDSPFEPSSEGKWLILKRQLKFAWHYMGPFQTAGSHFINNNGESLPNYLPHTDETFLMERTSCDPAPHLGLENRSTPEIFKSMRSALSDSIRKEEKN